jgi:GT2 family glycosyltransferase
VTSAPTASIVIATRGRPDYLDVALASVVPQAAAAGAEVIVVVDGRAPPSESVAQRHRTRLVTLQTQSGLSAARNAGVAAAGSPLVVFVDDDIEAPAGWLDALLAGARSAPDHDVFGGPIRARLEGGAPRSCGRESPPITTLDLGPEDRDVARIWGANMAIRRGAFDRVGPFDEALRARGDEEDWERRYAELGGRIRYLAAAGLDHRRNAADSRVGALARSAYRQGRIARQLDVRKGTAPSLGLELRTLAGCLWHTVRRRCAGGVVLAAESAGRLRETLARQRP